MGHMGKPTATPADLIPARVVDHRTSIWCSQLQSLGCSVNAAVNVELADGLGNLLSNVLQANLTEVSVRQNDDMRRISAWVAIWAIPTCWPAPTG